MAACTQSPPPLTQQEKQTVTELTKNLKPRCVGRYLIDLPNDALAVGWLTVQGVTFEATPMTREKFEQGMAAHQAELKAKPISRFGYRVLYKYGPVPELPHSWYFVTLKDLYDTADLERAIEAYRWDAGYQIKLRIEASDWVHSEYKKKFDGTPYHAVFAENINDVPEKVGLIISFIRRVRGRADDEIPTEPGVCFQGGFLSLKAGDGEDVSALFALKDKPDVSFDLETNTDLLDKPKDTLLNRLPEIRADIKDSHTNGHILRADAVDLGGIKAEEVLLSGITPARIDGHIFMLQANIATSGPLTPHLELEMDNGNFSNFTGNKIEKASLTEAEAIALWDVVSRTLRPRPNGF
jgi:hypothetical protein